MSAELEVCNRCIFIHFISFYLHFILNGLKSKFQTINKLRCCVLVDHLLKYVRSDFGGRSVIFFVEIVFYELGYFCINGKQIKHKSKVPCHESIFHTNANVVYENVVSIYIVDLSYRIFSIVFIMQDDPQCCSRPPNDLYLWHKKSELT